MNPLILAGIPVFALVLGGAGWWVMARSAQALDALAAARKGTESAQDMAEEAVPVSIEGITDEMIARADELWLNTLSQSGANLAKVFDTIMEKNNALFVGQAAELLAESVRRVAATGEQREIGEHRITSSRTPIAPFGYDLEDEITMHQARTILAPYMIKRRNNKSN